MKPLLLLFLLISCQIFAKDLTPLQKLSDLDYDALKLEMKAYYLTGMRPVRFSEAYRKQVQNFLAASREQGDSEGLVLAQMMWTEALLRARNLKKAEKEIKVLESMNLQGRYAKAQLYYLKAYILYSQDSLTESNRLLHKAQDLYMIEGKLELNVELCENLLLQAHVIENLEDNKKSIAVLEQAKKIVDTLDVDRNYRAQIYHDLGIAYSYISNLAQSMDLLFQALKVFQETKMYHMEISTLNQISYNKASLDQNDEVIFFYEKAVKQLKFLEPDNSLRAEIYGNLADAYNHTKNHGKAIEYIEKAIEFNQKYGQDKILVGNKINWAFFKNDAGRPQEALLALLKLKKIPEDYTRIWFHWAIAESYLMLGNLKDAKLQVDLAVTYAEELDWDDYLKSIYILASQVYEQLAIPSKALDYYKKFAKLEKKQLNNKNKNLLLSRELSYQKKENQSLESQNILKDQLIKEEVARRWALIIGLLITIAFLYVALRQKQVISTQSKTIRKIIENINEGILLLDSELKFYESSSPCIESLLPKLKGVQDISLKDFIGSLELDIDETAIVYEAIKSVFNMDDLQWEVALFNLPKLVHVGSASKFIEIDWNPIFNNNVLQQVVIVFRDITKRLELEKELYEENRKNNLSLTLLKIFNRDKNSLAAFFESSRNSIDHVNKMMSNIRQNINPILSILHTLKGNSRSLKMTDVANVIHNLETELKSDNFDEAVFRSDLEKFEQNFAINEGIYKNLFEASIPQYQPRHDLYFRHTTIISSLLEHIEEQGLKLRSINYHCELDDLEQSVINDISSIMNHSITNAIDHGYIHPLQQSRSEVKDIDLAITLIRIDGGFKITIADLGIGLNRDVIESICKKREFTPGPGEDIYQVLFLDEVSTSKILTKTSGRGVGTAAVKSIADSYKGRAKISPNLPNGTRIEVFIPESSLLKHASVS